MLKGNGITIRTVRKSDLGALYALSMDYLDAGEYMPVVLVSESDFIAEFDRNGFWRDTSGRLLIENDEGELVGEIGCFKVSHYMDGREVYYRVYSEHRRKGYAKEALRLFVQFFFESSAFSRLQGVTVTGNAVSEKLLEEAGFQFEGTLREARWFKGRLVDLNVYSCLRSDGGITRR